MKALQQIIQLGIALFLLSCGEKKEIEHTDVQEGANDRIAISKAQFEQNNMQLGTLVKMEFPQMVNVSGMIDVPPQNRAVVNATMGGYIKTTPFLIGDKVAKGQLLVTLENPEFVAMQQSFLEIHEQLAYLRAEFERQRTMKAENITSQKSFLAAESTYKTAMAKYKGLQKQLQMIHISPAKVIQGEITSTAPILAPISGSITKVNVTKGTYVSPATEIMEIIDNDHIHLELKVFEKDAMKIEKGQQVTFRIPEASETDFKAVVHLVGTSLDADRTIRVHAHLEDKEAHRFLTGMFVEAGIITSTQEGWGIPSAAVVNDSGKSYVLILRENKAGTTFYEQHLVTPLATYNGYTQIAPTDGLTANSQLLVQGAFSLIGA